MHPDVEELVKRLGLGPHPEGGFYRETWRSPQRVDGHPAGVALDAMRELWWRNTHASRNQAARE